MSSVDFRQPQFSEELAYLPVWLQKPQLEQSPPRVDSVCEAQTSSPPPPSSGRELNSKEEGRYKDCYLFLSAEGNSESTMAASPRNLLHLRLHISLDGDSRDSQCELSCPSDLHRGSSVFQSQHQVQGEKAGCRLRIGDIGGVNFPPADSTPAVMESGGLQVPSYNRVRETLSSPKRSWHCEDGDVKDAVELSIAASEALVMHELMKVESGLEGMAMATGSILEAALRVKQARLMEEGVEGGYYSGDEVDSLSDLGDSVMGDAFLDVGLCLDGAIVSGSDVSRVKETPVGGDVDGDDVNVSKLHKNQQVENVDGLDSGSNDSGMVCRANRSLDQQGGGKQHMRKHISKYFINEASFLSESADIAVNQTSCRPTIASQSSINFNGLQEKPHEGVLPSQEIRSSYVSASDPMCSIVPCSIPMEEEAASPANQNNAEVEAQNHFSHKPLPGLDYEGAIAKFEERNQDSPMNKNVNGDMENREETHCEPGKAELVGMCGGSFVPRRSPIVLNRRTRHRRLQACENLTGNDVPPVRCLEQDLPQNSTMKIDQSKSLQHNMPSGEVVSCTENNPVRTKRVRFSVEIQQEQTKCLVQRSKALSGGDKIAGTKDNKRSRVSKPSYTMKKCLLSHKQDLKRLIFHRLEFLITGFSYTKERELGRMIQELGGIVLPEIPSHRSSRSRGLISSYTQQLPIVICSRKLQTAKFLYGCAVNALILKARWITDSIAAGATAPPEKYIVRRNQADPTPLRMLLSTNPNTGPGIFHRVGIMLHGKPSFCRKLSLIIKHGGGQVFKTLQPLQRSLEAGKLARGVIVAEVQQSRGLRHLQHCASEQRIALMPASWMAKSLHSGKLDLLLPVQENAGDDALQETNSLDWSQEI